MYRLVAVAVLTVVVTLPLSVAASYWLGEQSGESRAQSGCLATVNAIASMKQVSKRR